MLIVATITLALGAQLKAVFLPTPGEEYGHVSVRAPISQGGKTYELFSVTYGIYLQVPLSSRRGEELLVGLSDNDTLEYKVVSYRNRAFKVRWHLVTRGHVSVKKTRLGFQLVDTWERHKAVWFNASTPPSKRSQWYQRTYIYSQKKDAYVLAWDCWKLCRR